MSEPLDDETERAVDVFDLATRRSVHYHNAEEYDTAKAALRQRIRVLVEEAEQNGIRVMARVVTEKELSSLSIKANGS